jgi:hypothetical protein
MWGFPAIKLFLIIPPSFLFILYLKKGEALIRKRKLPSWNQGVLQKPGEGRNGFFLSVSRGFIPERKEQKFRAGAKPGAPP